MSSLIQYICCRKHVLSCVENNKEKESRRSIYNRRREENYEKKTLNKKKSLEKQKLEEGIDVNYQEAAMAHIHAGQSPPEYPLEHLRWQSSCRDNGRPTPRH